MAAFDPIRDRKLNADLGPGFRLYVANKDMFMPVGEDIARFIRRVEYESSIDLADQLTITVDNPGFALTSDEMYSGPDFTSHKVFQPGNELELHVGYGGKYVFLARAILTKHLPIFPQDGTPQLVIKGYDKSQLMMDAAGPISVSRDNKVGRLVEGNLAGGGILRQAVDKDDQGKLYRDKTASDIVREVATKYGFATDIDPTDKVMRYGDGDGIVQKKGMTDFELCRILANLSRADLWVDYNPDLKQWVLHFKRTSSGETQAPGYVFRYGAGDKTTLLSFDCEYGLRDNITELVVLAWDADRAEWISVARVEDIEGPDPRWRQGGGRMERTKPTVQEDPTKKPASSKTRTDRVKQAAGAADVIGRTLRSATEFRFAAAGTAIDVVTGRTFRDMEEAANFAYRWFKANKDNFLVAKGGLVGVETLRSRQVHRFEGLGARLSGDYYLIAVNHILDADTGYNCDYTARKVLDDTGAG